MPRAKGVKVVGGDTAKARWAFYKRLTELGCVYCATCRCYTWAEHECQGLAWMQLNPSTYIEGKVAVELEGELANAT